MAIMSRRKNIIGSRAKKFQAGAAKRTINDLKKCANKLKNGARQVFLERIMQLPDDEEERKRKAASKT